MNPSTDNYTLGRGVAYFNRRMPDGSYLGERDLGNAPALTFNTALEKLPHLSSRGGLKAKDKEVIVQITPTLALTLDEISVENLSLMSLGDIEKITQSSGSVSDEEHTAHLGRRIELAHRSVSSVVVTLDAGGTLVAGTDYVVDTSLKDDVIGRVLILPTATGVTEGAAIKISYDYGDVEYHRIKMYTQTEIEGAFRYVSDNPVGTQQELRMWRVSLTPGGETSMIGDDWSTLQFTGEVLRDSVNHPDCPYGEFILP